MSWLLFYLLAALHPIAFIAIGLACKTWRQRLLLWALLPIPAIFYCWDYFVIKNEHEQVCAADGGLKVLIQPEKVDRVRLIGVELRDASTGMQAKYFPRLQAVEALAGKYDGTDGRGQPYVVYTSEPNPRVGESLPYPPWKEPKFIVSAPNNVEDKSPNLFEISVHESQILHGTRKETRLSKDGTVYAKYTDIVHWWSGIRYPDAVPTWRCPEQKKSPPKDEPNPPHEKWDYPPLPAYALVELILK